MGRTVKDRMSEKTNKIVSVVLSLLLAVAFWLYVDDSQGSRISSEFTSVPIDFIGAEDTLPSRGLMLASGGDTTLNLKLSGPRAVISNLRDGDVRAQVSLTDINAAGSYSRGWTLVLPEDVDRSAIEIERQSRMNISVQVTNLYSQEIPVRVDVIGEVSDPYVYLADRVTKEPATLTVSGLQDSVGPVASARIVVDITGATSTIQQEYSYELLDSEGNVLEDPEVKVSDQRVNVTVPVHMVKELPLVIDYKESPGSRMADADCNLEPSTIVVTGEPLSLETIDEINLGEVDLSMFYTDNYEEDIEIKLPAGCENSSGYKTTHLTIQFHDLETRAFTVTNIKPRGLSESQRFDLITTSLNVVLRGPSDDLAQVTEEDIRVVVDLTEIASNGTIQPQATVLVDGYSNVGAVGTYNVTGKIISG